MGISLKLFCAEKTVFCASDLALPLHVLCLTLPSTAWCAIGEPSLTLNVLDSDINALILDYLTAEGYPSAADKFSKEANLEPLEDQEFVVKRNQIKNDIHLGNIQSAIEAINDLSPQVSRNTQSFCCCSSCYDYTVHAPLIIAFGSLMRKIP